MSTIQQLLELDGETLNSKVSYLLGTSTKIEKTWKELDVGTLVMYLSPHVESGWNLCPWASAGCAAACLKGSGRMRFKGSELARVKRTVLFMKHRELFMARLRKEIRAHVAKCARLDLECSVRLNGTSDVAWERVCPELFKEFAHVQFYDYTKSVLRAIQSVDGQRRGELRSTTPWPANYHLTFSRCEDTPLDEILYLTEMGVSVAVVFNKRVLDWEGMDVIDGDRHDYRASDPRGVIVGLKAKGPEGKADKSGFVVRI